MTALQNDSFRAFWEGPAPQALSKLLPATKATSLEKNRLYLLHQLFLEASRIANNKSAFAAPFAASFGLKHKNCSIPLAKIYFRVLKGLQTRKAQPAAERSMPALGDRLNWIFSFHQQAAFYYLKTAEENARLFNKENSRWHSAIRQKNWSVLVDFYQHGLIAPYDRETPRIRAVEGALFPIERQRLTRDIKQILARGIEGLPIPQTMRNLSLQIAEDELAAKKGLAVCEGLGVFIKDLCLFLGRDPSPPNEKDKPKKGKILSLFPRSVS